MSKRLYKGHNLIDIDGDSIIIYTPFYRWLVMQREGGYTYNSLLAALDHYLSLKLGHEFITDKQHMCYKFIHGTFIEREVIGCPLTR